MQSQAVRVQRPESNVQLLHPGIPVCQSRKGNNGSKLRRLRKIFIDREKGPVYQNKTLANKNTLDSF